MAIPMVIVLLFVCLFVCLFVIIHVVVFFSLVNVRICPLLYLLSILAITLPVAKLDFYTVAI